MTEPAQPPPSPPEPSYRTDPPFRLEGEAAMLASWLDFHRATLRWKCEGLTGEQLVVRSAPPSSLSPLGLVRHLSEVERSWFQRVLAGHDAPPLYFTDEEPDLDIDGLDPGQAEGALTVWQQQVETSREIAGAYGSMDVLSRGHRHGQQVSLRWIMIHMIEEYARHNGHADLLRERIDGVVGE